MGAGGVPMLCLQEVGAPLSTRGREELIGGVLKDGSLRWRPTVGLSHEDDA
jgi:hypothetical protein